MFFSMIKSRRAQLAVVDKRVRLLSEIISSIRAVKLYAYEAFFGEKVMELRRKELEMLRRNGANRAVMFSTLSFVPTLATVCESKDSVCGENSTELALVTFITYSLSGHALSAPVIFTGLQYFNIIKLQSHSSLWRSPPVQMLSWESVSLLGLSPFSVD